MGINNIGAFEKEVDAAMNEKMTFKLFDSCVLASNNIVAFNKHIFADMSKKLLCTMTM